MERTHGDLQNPGDPHREVESHQLLSRTSPTPTIAFSVRSQHAPFSDVSSRLLLSSGAEGDSRSTGRRKSFRSDDGTPQWTPLVLRWYFIMIPAVLAVTFIIVTATLHAISSKNNGLGPENSAIPGWKFIPTLIAVIYTQLTAMILGAVKRTEPFARLAKAPGHIPFARYTLLEKTKPWWTTLVHGFQKERHNGTRNWAIIASCIVYILAILGISPISAALLGSKEIRQGTTESYVRLDVHNNAASPLRPSAKRDTYLQTTGAILQNYSTSPWITNDYLVMPFWPADLRQTESPWNFKSLQADSWEANTTVLRNDLICTDLHLRKKDMYLRHAIKSPDPIDDESRRYNKTYLASVLLESDHGCRFNLTTNATAQYNHELTEVDENWMSWGDSQRIMFRDAYSKDAVVRLNEDCPEDEIILMSTPWWKEFRPEKLWDNLTVRAYACHSDHTMANMPVRITGEPDRQTVQFDEEMFHRIRTPINPAMIDFEELRNIYQDVVWGEFIPQKPSSSAKKGFLGGSAAVLGRGYNFSIPDMMADSALLSKAELFRRRFFAEIVGATMQKDTKGAVTEQRTDGRSYRPLRRVIVSGQAASILCALLTVSFFALLCVIWWTRPMKRSLGLYCDPSMALGIALWANGNPGVLAKFRGLEMANRQSMKENFSGRVFLTRNGRLHETRERGDVGMRPLDQRKRKAEPVAKSASSVLPGLRLRNILSLLLYIIGLLAGMAVLFWFAQRSELHQAFFTYRANVTLFGNTNTISPFAIIPTILAVVIAMWWESIDSTCRSVQPYISMYKGAETPLRSTGLSYASSFWLWVSFKALRNRHWLLSLVAATTFSIQVFTIAMSALFDSGTGTISLPVTISPTLELRQVPLAHIMTTRMSEREWTDGPPMGPNNNQHSTLTEDFYDLKADWLYTAMIQTALHGPAPAWSRDDWSFVPVSFTPENLLSAQNIVSRSEDAVSSVNVTVRTPALRAMLDCSVIEMAKNASKWVTWRNSTTNGTGLDGYYQLQGTMFRGFRDNQTTRVTAQGVSPQCCGNVTKSTAAYDPAVVAYWTENWISDGSTILVQGDNFTIKWIRGPAGFAQVSGYTDLQNLIFTEPPVMQALDCRPEVQASEAEVLVDLTSGVVQDYRILSAPVSDDVAWSDSWVYRNLTKKPLFQNTTDYTDERNYFDINVTTSYGVYFMKSLLRAACLDMTGAFHLEHPGIQYMDRLDDKVFNMRDNTTGLNTDFMSYAAYAQAKLDPTALLDADVLLNTSRKIFSTFFQHFVNNNVSAEQGGYAYQPAGLHDDMTPPFANFEGITRYTPKGDIAPRFQDVHRNTNKTVTATLSTRVEVLQINTVAFWIATGILIWLIIIIVIFASVQRRYYSGMMRNVECIADVLVLIAGSDQLLAAVKEKGVNAILKDNNLLTRLGWFRDPDGTMRWRIELVESDQGVLMQPISLNSSYAPVPGDEGLEETRIT
ncbi:hypothetical protein OPT61_g1379 [Boeremia exigua]|uniref:Uncharacterized protein n=1 Tax=Boeremia exigua TaxID=749465 RepID=A0ACC2IQK5_9PLEO|nr:hypothetical protein OPT61_g1379 [Boeremia exigua]